jgi:DNA gyrase subunit A
MENPKSTLEELIEIIPGPDFPTGGLILGRSGIRSAYSTGRGSVMMRGASHDRGDSQGPRSDHHHRDSLSGEQGDDDREDRRTGAREAHRGHLRHPRRIDREGMRVVIEIKRDAVADVVLNQLYRFTPLQTSFGANMVALNGGKPELMTSRIDLGLRRVPRGGRLPADALPAQQGPRPRPCAGAALPSPSPTSTRSSA